MHLSLIVLIKYIFQKFLLFYSFLKNFFSYDCIIFVSSTSYYLLNLLLKYNTFFYNTLLLDTCVWENNFVTNKFFYSVMNIFFLKKVNLKLYLNCITSSNLISSAPLFFNLEWTEREISEMFGLYYLNKKDNRKLLLDYSFNGFPMLKNFPVIGNIEIIFNYFDIWITYQKLTSSESTKYEINYDF